MTNDERNNERNEYTVNVVYKNRQMKKIGETDYPFQSYCEQQRTVLMRTLGRIEQLLGEYEHNPNWREWEGSVADIYKDIRNNMLDVANNIYRLPSSLRRGGEPLMKMETAAFLAKELS